MGEEINVHIQHGFQARNATEFVRKSSSFSMKSTLLKTEDQLVKVLWELRPWPKGEEVILFADGDDKQEAVVTLERVLVQNFKTLVINL
ncbi:HPr family phosphocarrier protein [Priestia megaterium]|uniref:HPr family phosphocarrier protein n=1 Tax=Bacillaceae TaxID=186817 RepID=UPI00077C3E6D|nr:MULTISPECIES: HPr family phosphocarrier protein [Bacillaceae]MED4566462.1 HPr family phosphocarrier protein [Bacillus atrophaeus]MED4589862.1 HPr family phosphocarrier protein [Priestia flexa]